MSLTAQYDLFHRYLNRSFTKEDILSQVLDSVFVGVDPGQKGSIAISVDHYGQPTIISTLEMPDSLSGVWRLFEKVRSLARVTTVVVEEQQALPNSMRGSLATSKLFLNYGWCCMAAYGNGHRLYLSRAQDWHKALHLKKMKEYAERKRYLRGQAEQRHPYYKVTADNADAILLAEYCMREYSTQNQKAPENF